MSDEQPQDSSPGIHGLQWYFRYPLALLPVPAAVWLAVTTHHENDWIGLLWIGAAAVMTICLARELTVALLLLAFLYWTARSVADMPTSVAIIIAAVIIAAAIISRRSRQSDSN